MNKILAFLLRKMGVEPVIYKPVWRIYRHKSEEDYRIARALGNLEYLADVSVIEGNAVLYQGWALLWDLMYGNSVAHFDNANARLLVGDSSASVTQSQTGLQGTSFNLSMDSGYPQKSGANNQNLLFQGTAGSSTGNQAWNEFGVDNGTTLFNRKVSAQGTKSSGQTWTLQLELQGQ